MIKIIILPVDSILFVPNVLRIWYTSIYVQMYNAIENTAVLHMCVTLRIYDLLWNTYAMLSCEYQGTSHTPIAFSLYTQSPKGSYVYLENSSDSYGIFHTIPLEIVSSISFFSSPDLLTMCWHCNRKWSIDHSDTYLLHDLFWQKFAVTLNGERARTEP